MVDVEIRRPYFDEESRTIEWQHLALVRADSTVISIYGESSCVLDGPVVDATTGDVVDRATSPERWARNLPDAYRSGDLVALILHDDDPVAAEADGDIDEPTIPDPPAPEFTDDPQTESIAVAH
jgi:hypothetical protein